uniref:peptidylprolyl isomerase n=1 Tax=Parascaris univalens TaxID=6257 RepID=A0A915B1N1_PARUN
MRSPPTALICILATCHYVQIVTASVHVVDTQGKVPSDLGKKRHPEDNIPVVEIRGEGKPMTAAQIRQLEEASNGGPLDIKVENTWRPIECPRAAKRKDFVTFHYKAFTEAGKKFDQTYGKEPIRIQLGVGMTMPGLDKGLQGMCDTELRKIHVPYRLSRKRKSRVWKNILNDEHWLIFNVEMMHVEPWSHELQFQFLDLNNDTFLTQNELVKFQEKMKKDFGKTWSNEDIDTVVAAKYYIKYFDADGDGKVDLKEFRAIMERDLATMAANKPEKKIEGRKRDPGIAWILDFNNDGIVSVQENDRAAEVLEGKPAILPKFTKDEL